MINKQVNISGAYNITVNPDFHTWHFHTKGAAGFSFVVS